MGTALYLFIILFYIQGFTMNDDAYIGEIRIFAGQFVPMGWLLCDGSQYYISQYPALASIIGNLYGGSGSGPQQKFAVPDLCGRAACATGQGTGLSIPWTLAQKRGAETTSIFSSQIPSHTHLMACNNTANSGTQNTPLNNFMGVGVVDRSTGSAVNMRFATSLTSTQPSSTNTMAAQSLSAAGSSPPQAISIMQPSLAMYFIICQDGLYPQYD